MKFRKKPVVIEAVRFAGGNFCTIWEVFPESRAWKWWVSDRQGWCFDIPTLEGTMTAQDGDWIIRGVKGEFYQCKPDIFAETYEAVEPAPSEEQRGEV